MTIGLDIRMSELNVRNATSEILEKIDNDITYAINVARKFVEEPNRKVLYSYTKLMKYVSILYWKIRIKKKVGHIVNEDKLEERRVLINIDNNESLLKEQLEENLEIAKREWQEVVKYR